MLLVSFKSLDCDQIFMGSLQKHKCFWKGFIFRLVQLPFRSVGSAWRWSMGGWLSYVLWCQGLGHLHILGICTRRGSCSQSLRDTGGRLWKVLWILPPPFPTYPSSSIFLPSLSPTPSFKAHSTCSGPYCSDGVKEQSEQWRTVDIIMLLVTVIHKHLVLKVC